jgi:hypothetical protein
VEKHEAELVASLSRDIGTSARRFEIEGRSLGFPTQFRDASSALGLFLVPSRAANALISESGFEVAQVAPGRAIFSLSCVNYRESDCGSYREISMAFFVTKHGSVSGIPYLGTWLDIARDRGATYVWRLPVTTRLANDAGIQMWGLPKTIEELEFEVSGGRASFDLCMEGRKVLSYSVRALGNRSQPRGTSAVYSIFEGAPHVTHLSHEYRDMGVRLGGGELCLGDHPAATQLRGLGLPRRPLVSSWIGRLALEVSAPEKL